MEVLRKLQNAGFTFEKQEEQKDVNLDQRFFKKTFVFTGKLKSFTRDSAREAVEERGAISSNAVSKKVDYVVVGEDAGSKQQKALSLGLKIITEEEFELLLKE